MSLSEKADKNNYSYKISYQNQMMKLLSDKITYRKKS